MNERLKQLEKQCWSHRVDGVLIDGHLHFDTKKFAELIIQECIDCINRVGILEDVEFQSGMIAQNVREHFGVE